MITTLLFMYGMIFAFWARSLVGLGYFEEQKKTIISEENTDYKLSRPWREFEKEIARIFEQKGAKTILGPGEADDGIDIRIRRKGKVYVIQCKHRFKKSIHPKDIREFQGAIYQYNQEHKNDAKGIFITTGPTTPKAREVAQSLCIELRDQYSRKKKIKAFRC